MSMCCAGRHPNDAGALWCRECGSLIEGASVGEYRLLSFVGRGSSADVYLAEQPALNRRRVVIKILPQTRFSASIEAFRHEAEVLASLSHPYILPIFAYGVLYREQKRRDVEYDAKDLCLPYLVLPYAERGSLDEMFKREGERPWSPGRVVTMAREIAEALDYAHEQGILHRDVKPANILHMGSHALLSDFSVASLIDADASHLNAPWAGSPAYMAPEVWQLHPGRYSDQYSLAVVCFYLLTGQLPWRKTEESHRQSWAQLHNFVPPRSLTEAYSGAPPALDFVLQRALAKDPHLRYPSVQDFAHDLRAASRDITQQVISVPFARNAQAHDIVVASNQVHDKQEYRVAPTQAVLRGERETPRLPLSAPPVYPLSTPISAPVDLPALPGAMPEMHTTHTDSLKTIKQLGRRDWWIVQALLLNLGLCLALAGGDTWQTGDIASGGRALLALWPVIMVGPLMALIFRRVQYQSLSWGMFWGAFFGLTNGLLSVVLCMAWIVLAYLPLSNTCSPGCSVGNGFWGMLQEAVTFAPLAIVPIVMGLWITVIGGALIGIFHTREE